MSIGMLFSKKSEENLVHLVFPFTVATFWTLAAYGAGKISEESLLILISLIFSIGTLVSLFMSILRPIEVFMAVYLRLLARLQRESWQINTPPATLFESPLFSHPRNRLNLQGYFILGLVAGGIINFTYEKTWPEALLIASLSFGLGIVLLLVFLGEISGTQWKLKIINEFYSYQDKVGFIYQEKASKERIQSLLDSSRLAIISEDWRTAKAYLYRVSTVYRPER